MDAQTIIWIPIITAIITLVFNIGFHSLKNKLDWFVDTKKFKREHNFNQLKELYLLLYGIIVQSEYIRFFSRKYRNSDYDIQDIPFLEVRKTVTKVEKDKTTTEEIRNEITEFNKLGIVSKIIEKSEFASQRLLKLAVAYRYVHSNYQKRFTGTDIGDNYKSEELKLIYLLVTTIIKECNEMLEECNMDYDGKEISYGIMNYDVFEEEK